MTPGGAWSHLDSSPNFHIERNRLASYRKWTSFQGMVPMLARSGFYLIGPQGLSKCAFCDVEIGGWRPRDDVVFEHLLKSSNCPLLRGQKTRNRPIDAEAFRQILPVLLDLQNVPSEYPRGEAETSANLLNEVDSRPLSPVHLLEGNEPSREEPEVSIIEPNVVTIRSLSPVQSISTVVTGQDSPPDYNREDVRLASFRDLTTLPVPKFMLAKIGFYLIGPSDLSKCAFCEVEIGMWQPEDDVVFEHLRWSTDCSLLRGRETRNRPINEESLRQILPIEYIIQDTASGSSRGEIETSINTPNASNMRSLSPPREMEGNRLVNFSVLKPKRVAVFEEYVLKSRRMNSLKNWPISIKQRPAELAEAGLFYNGFSDVLTCHSCGLRLKDWKSSEIPWEKHALLCSDCDFLRLRKGDKFIREVRKREIFEPASESEEPVIAQVIAEERLCAVCYEEQFDTVFLPCMHCYGCSSCAASVEKCGICKQEIRGMSLLFLP